MQGCDASILIHSTPRNQAELDAGPNLTIHGLDLIDTAKAALEKACPGVVSCADIIALATRDAVVLVGRRRNLYCLINTRSFVQLPVCNVGKLSVYKSLLEPFMSKRNFVSPSRGFPTIEKFTNFHFDIGSQYPSRWLN